MKQKHNKQHATWRSDFQKNKALYIIMIPSVLYILVLHYIPMFGILMAFQDFSIRRGIFGSTWVGLDNFVDLFTGGAFLTAFRNTLAMAGMNLTIGFIMPLIFAFLITEIKRKKFKRILQTISYMPHFVAAVVVVQLIKEFVGRNGAITMLLSSLGFEKQNWLANAEIPVFWLINTFAGVWQTIGFGSIMFVAAIAIVSDEYYEAAVLDGASKWQRLTKITIPAIMPTIVMLFTLRIGLVFVTGFDKILLMYMPMTYEVSDVLTTYTYRMAFGTSNANYGLAAASGLFQSVISLALVIIANRLSKKFTDQTVF